MNLDTATISDTLHIDILLVEDNPDHAALVTRGLQYHEVANTIVIVPDGEAAINYLNKAGPYASDASCHLPNVILMDLHLPKLNGLEAIKIIKENPLLAPIKIIVLTTSDRDEDIKAACSYKDVDYLVKPEGIFSFSDMLKEKGQDWALNHTSPPSF